MFDVIVGNIGTVRSNANITECERVFAEYVSQSKSGIGRAGGEDVTITVSKTGEIYREYFGTNGEKSC